MTNIFGKVRRKENTNPSAKKKKKFFYKSTDIKSDAIITPTRKTK